MGKIKVSQNEDLELGPGVPKWKPAIAGVFLIVTGFTAGALARPLREVRVESPPQYSGKESKYVCQPGQRMSTFAGQPFCEFSWRELAR